MISSEKRCEWEIELDELFTNKQKMKLIGLIWKETMEHVNKYIMENAFKRIDITLAERERCVKIAERFDSDDALQIAQLIREDVESEEMEN